jgi:hypothetical protein
MHANAANIYFFGCWDRPGHYLWKPDGSRPRYEEKETPFGYTLDGGLLQNQKYWQNKLSVVHTIADGWTVISWWDNSVDERPGSNANFVAKGEYSRLEMVEFARLYFPELMHRFTNLVGVTQ